MLGVIGDLERVAGVVGGEIGDEDERLACALLLVIHSDVVDFHLGMRPSRAMPIPLMFLASGKAMADG